jgi:hypothetical protein
MGIKAAALAVFNSGIFTSLEIILLPDCKRRLAEEDNMAPILTFVARVADGMLLVGYSLSLKPAHACLFIAGGIDGSSSSAGPA